MIGISLSKFIVTVTLFGVCFVCALWFYYLWRDRRRELRRRRIAIQCRICGHTYPAGSKDKGMSHCPSCGARNERHGLAPI
jgi:hypothetical protein